MGHASRWLTERAASPAALAERARTLVRELRTLARDLDAARDEVLDALDAETEPAAKDALREWVGAFSGNAHVARDAHERLDGAIRGGLGRHAAIDAAAATQLRAARGPS